VDLPVEVKIGKHVEFAHNSVGTVIHGKTTIEDNVKIYQNVTLGIADIYSSNPDRELGRFVIKEGAVIGAGAKIICKKGVLIVGENSVIGANAVLLNSTGPGEIWAGIPARCIGTRHDIATLAKTQHPQNEK